MRKVLFAKVLSLALLVLGDLLILDKEQHMAVYWLVLVAGFVAVSALSRKQACPLQCRSN